MHRYHEDSSMPAPRSSHMIQEHRSISCKLPLVPFASSGMNKADFALCATQKSLGSRAGASTIAFPVLWVVRAASRTESYFIRSATTGFTTSVSLSRNRVSLQEAFEGLACVFSCSGSKRAPFFQSVKVTAAILRASVRRASSGFIPLASNRA